MSGGSSSARITRRGFVKSMGAASALTALGAYGMSSTDQWLSQSSASAQTPTTSAYTYHNEHCLCNCVFECSVRDGRLRMVQPRKNEDHRFQNICVKGISEVEHIYGSTRIMTPLRRVGERGSGQFEQISWDEAFQLIAQAIKASQEKYGKESVWVQFSTESQQRFAPLLPSLLQCQTGGLNGYDMGQGNGQGQCFGWSGMFAQNTIWEWPEADTVVLVNNNMLETAMMWSRGMLDAKEAGTKFIVIDPRFSPTASKADTWVPLRAGTDPALFLGMINYILENKLYDEKHIKAHTALCGLVRLDDGTVYGESFTGKHFLSGQDMPAKHPYVWDEQSQSAVRMDACETPTLEGSFEIDGVTYETQFTRLLREMKSYTLEWTEQVSGVSADLVRQIATQYASGKSIIANGVGGIDKFGNNDIAGHCYALIATLTANYGYKGTGCGIYTYHVTPYEPHLGAWKLPEEYHPAPSKMGFYDMVTKDDSVHCALFFGDIPTQKAANWSRTKSWIDSLDFVALVDVYHSSVADYVDVILPACSKFESIDEIGGIKSANGFMMTNQKVLDPLFESKPDFYIEKGIAEALGLGDLMPKDSLEYAEAILNTEDPLVDGITLESLKAENGVQKLTGNDTLLAPEVGFSYPTPSTRQEPYYENMLKWGQAFPAWERPNEAYPENPLREKYPLQFSQARSRFHIHSTYTGAAWIKELYEPHIELNPIEADQRGLKDGDMVDVFNDRGSFTVKLRINEAIRPESAFMVESSYASELSGTLMQSVTNDQLNERGYEQPFGPMIPFNDTLIEIRKSAGNPQSAFAPAGSESSSQGTSEEEN